MCSVVRKGRFSPLAGEARERPVRNAPKWSRGWLAWKIRESGDVSPRRLEGRARQGSLWDGRRRSLEPFLTN